MEQQLVIMQFCPRYITKETVSQAQQLDIMYYVHCTVVLSEMILLKRQSYKNSVSTTVGYFMYCIVLSQMILLKRQNYKNNVSTVISIAMSLRSWNCAPTLLRQGKFNFLKKGIYWIEKLYFLYQTSTITVHNSKNKAAKSKLFQNFRKALTDVTLQFKKRYALFRVDFCLCLIDTVTR